MDEQEFEKYQREITTQPTISWRDFEDRGYRLLMRGYTAERETFEVWHDPDYEILTRIIGPAVLGRKEWPADLLHPEKRAYIEDTDYHFAVLMNQRATHGLSFTNKF